MNEDILLRARAVIADHTPMVFDCGQLCHSACCRPDEDGQGGVYLFPGEADLFSHCAWAKITPSAFAPILICEGTCPRDARPMGCRIFPLSPVRGPKGQWTVRLDARARAMCPLTGSGIRGLNPAFVRAVRDAVRLMAADAQGEAFLEAWSALEEAYRFEL